jgi:hypothetical protein
MLRIATITTLLLCSAGIASAGVPVKYTPVAIFSDLRNQALGVKGTDVGVTKGAYGILMETGYPEAVATLFALADGSTSLYFSSGGGTIGAGQHAKPAAAAIALVKRSGQDLSHPTKTSVFPLPQQGHTRFYVLTTDGVFTAEIPEIDLGENHHALSTLFHTAHALIYEISQIEGPKR